MTGCDLLETIRGTLKYLVEHLLSESISFFTNPNRIIPQLRPKGLLNHQNRFKRLNINLTEQPLKPPPNSLPCHPKGFVNLLTVCPF
jgi:hypothetical protein